jgi:hypothetical protein
VEQRSCDAGELALAIDPEFYRELVDGTYGDRIRLEQERVNYPAIETAGDALSNELGC